MRVKIKKTLLSTFIIFAMSTSLAYADTLNLNVSSTQQEQSNWCWAACSQCTANYIKKTSPSQSDIVKYVKGSVVNDPCYPYEQVTALNYCGVNTTYVNGTIAYSEIIRMIKGWYSPIVAHIAWSSGGGHAVVIYGYNQSSTYNGISYMDPFASNYRWNFCDVSYFKSNSDFSWVRTYYQNK